MEQQIETIIDNGLESMAPVFNVCSIIIGFVLLFVGIILLLRKKRKKVNIALICITIGVIAIISGILHEIFK